MPQLVAPPSLPTSPPPRGAARRRGSPVLGAVVALVAGVLGAVLPAQAARADDTANARADAAANALLGYYTPASGAWSTPTGEDWQPPLQIEAIENQLQRTGDARWRDVLNRSFARYKGNNPPWNDDKQWWAVAWIRAYDLTGDTAYLDEAKRQWGVVKAFWDDACGGGVWNDSSKPYKNGIVNELFLLTSARLAERTPGDDGDGSYRDYARRTWTWLNANLYVPDKQLMKDKLDTTACPATGTGAWPTDVTWTYDQGITVLGLLELNQLTGDSGYLDSARAITAGVRTRLVTSGGILQEVCDGPGSPQACNNDQAIFKGIYVNALAQFVRRAGSGDDATFLARNADSLWANGRSGDDHFDRRWDGPYSSTDGARTAAGALLFTGHALSTSSDATTPSSSGRLRTDLQQLCAGVDNEADGQQLKTRPCDGAPSFTLTKSGKLKLGNRCLGVNGGNGNAGDSIILWSCNGNADQTWGTGGGTLTGINGRCIGVDGGNTAVGTRLLLWDCNGNSDQRWSFA